ncbi:deoxycytidylate deaminase-like [Lingula anatina]|uniref:dCMP deaminase n=1 Tax=Lingula anatina TaxID=7574 RepID=A0A1S3J268_LINAN|nr:deoxycytidylate deaminase-like [Lingula anatina]|eukprot:XP_013403944.1 deoxycytidylate deaminase-like [Lingula anatina]
MLFSTRRSDYLIFDPYSFAPTCKMADREEETRKRCSSAPTNGLQSTPEKKPCLTSRDENKKREDYLEWSEYFMAIAFLSAQRSKDPNSQVGACIVNQENKIVGIGYNGMPNGCNDDFLPWRRVAENKLDTKYPYGKSLILKHQCHAIIHFVRVNRII